MKKTEEISTPNYPENPYVVKMVQQWILPNQDSKSKFNISGKSS